MSSFGKPKSHTVVDPRCSIIVTAEKKDDDILMERRSETALRAVIENHSRHERELRTVMSYTVTKLLGRPPSLDILESYLAEGREFFRQLEETRK